MTKQRLHEKIEAYLLKQLLPEDAAAFELEIQKDPDLAKVVESHRVSLLVPRRLAQLDLEARFDQWRTDSQRESPTTRFRLRWPWVVTLSILLVLTGGGILWQKYQQKISQEQLEKEQYEKAWQSEKLRADQLESELEQLLQDVKDKAPERSLSKEQAYVRQPVDTTNVTTLPEEPVYAVLAYNALNTFPSGFSETIRGIKSSTPSPAQTLVSQANDAIRKKSFAKAEILIEQIDSNAPQYTLAQEMLAYVYLRRKKYVQAVNTYRRYMEEDSDTDKTGWNLCLFYLADYPQYKTLFQTALQKILDDPDHSYYSRAQTLRQTLADKNIWPR
ncbi:MAG: hypothetical protein H6574_16090 [Lewinellaceae bacterium]|nr:hypothetical protein [Lewinellaceae bacterium]